MDVEGYPGLVVHGPLTATLLMRFCIHTLNKSIGKFEFRAMKPLFDIERFTLNIFKNEENGTIDVFATNLNNEICMSANVIMS